jgi:hypothetical protein
MQRAAAADAWVGRADLAARLRTDLDAARAGAGRLLLVAGEPGIGKTRAAEEAVRLGAERGLVTLVARCRREASAFWPWAGVLRTLRPALGAGWLGRLGPDAALLRLVAPELAPEAPFEPPRLARGGAEGSFQLADAIARAIAEAAHERPLLLVLDDLHEADAGTLLALSLLGDGVASRALCVVATHRDAEADATPALATALARIARCGTRVSLGGLSVDEVTELLAACGAPRSADLGARVHARTGGNPLFVVELARDLASGGAEDALPSGVRDVVRARLALVDAEVRDLLAVCALIGEPLDVALLARASGRSAAHVMQVLAEARRAGLLREASGGATFPHDLMRDAIAAELEPVERARLHAQIGAALETEGPAEGERLARLAHHFAEGAVHGVAERAVAHARAAAARERERGAFAAAAALLQRALAAHALVSDAEPAARGALLLALGEAEASMGHGDAARVALAEAAAIARERRDPEALARAALAWPASSAAQIFPGRYGDPDAAKLLAEALTALPPAARALRARILAALASADPDRDATTRSALALARESGDADALAEALVARHWALWGPAHAHERLALADELVALARRLGDRVVELRGEAARIADLLELGERAALEEAAARLDALVARMPLARFRFSARALAGLRAFLDADLAGAERCGAEALAIGRDAEVPESAAVFAAQLMALRQQQGRLAELEPALRAAGGASGVGSGLAAAAHALALFESRRVDEARAVFEPLADADLCVTAGDAGGAARLLFLAELCVALGDRSRAARLYEHLLPYAERHVVVGGALCFGSAARLLARLAALDGRSDEARVHFETALAREAALGARPWLAHARADFAAWLAASQRAADRERARVLAADALRDADAHGLEHVRRKLAQSGFDAARAACAEPVFRYEGDHWTLAYDGVTTRVRDVAGLHLLRRLVEEPGREIHVAELMEATVVGGDAGERLDATARAAYRTRLADVEAELAAAESRGDLGRVERLRHEAETVRGELAASVALGGRTRRAGDPHERVRKAAYRRVQLALARIESGHPALARHLRAAIRTGTTCAYDPEHPLRWRVD